MAKEQCLAVRDYYYLGYFAEKLGQAPKASEYYKVATAMPPDYVFPFQAEVIDVLRAAMKANPRDARAPYYLGNLLYDWQPEEAARLWEASGALDFRHRAPQPGDGLRPPEARGRHRQGHRRVGEGDLARS